MEIILKNLIIIKVFTREFSQYNASKALGGRKKTGWNGYILTPRSQSPEIDPRTGEEAWEQEMEMPWTRLGASRVELQPGQGHGTSDAEAEGDVHANPSVITAESKLIAAEIHRAPHKDLIISGVTVTAPCSLCDRNKSVLTTT